MNRRLTSAALLLAACCLAACGAPKAAPSAPQVTGVSATEAAAIAGQFCSDLAKMSDESAVQRMAVRASESKLSAADQDAIVDYAGKVACPEQF